LIHFVKINNSKEVSNLLEIASKDLRPEINIRDEFGNCPLHYACINGNYDVSLILLKNEADCDAIN